MILGFRVVEEVGPLRHFVVDVPGAFFLLDLLIATVGKNDMIGCRDVSVGFGGR